MSAVKTQRNDPCPCGSGKKYKHCHLGQEDGIADASGVSPKAGRRRVVMVLVAIALALAVAAGFWKGFSASLVVAAACALGIGGFIVLSDPPGPSGRSSGEGAGINFGV